MPFRWQYHLTNSIDGKSPGWYDFSPSACNKLDSFWEENNASGTKRTTYHLKSGYFNYEVNLVHMTQRNMQTGTVRDIRRLPANKKQKLEHQVSCGAQPMSATHSQSHEAFNESSLELAALFDGGFGSLWLKPLSNVLTNLSGAQAFIGPNRDKLIMPLRELTFQALKPNAPVDWRVVVFGQNPYPRLEAATGIAMFDAALDTWDSKTFGKTVSMRCIIKAAAMATHGIPQATTIGDLRKLLSEKKVVTPPQWFQAMLTQGVLLLNASLTVGGSDFSNNVHAKFWRPVVERIIEEILKAKSALADGDQRKGIVFLHWGAEALKTKKAMTKILAKYEGSVEIQHCAHCNPAAQGDLFCKAPPHFIQVNDMLKNMGQKEINWLPDDDWLKSQGWKSTEHGEFITKTQELHQLYLQRLQSGLDSVIELKPIVGVLNMPLISIIDACDPLNLKHEAEYVRKSVTEMFPSDPLNVDEASCIRLYTGNSLFYKLNQALRDPKRDNVKAYFYYLRLFLAAHDKLPEQDVVVYRGIGKDLSSIYKKGCDVTWYSVSSCTLDRSVAEGFAGCGKGGTLFRINAKSAKEIMAYSMFQSEKELVLAPGTKLRVVTVKKSSYGLSEIVLNEVTGERMVN